jgi:hypothetical protein
VRRVDRRTVVDGTERGTSGRTMVVVMDTGPAGLLNSSLPSLCRWSMAIFVKNRPKWSHLRPCLDSASISQELDSIAEKAWTE